MDPTCLRTRARRVDPYSLTFVTQSHNFLSMTPESKLYLVSLTNNFCCFLVKIFEHLFFFFKLYIYNFSITQNQNFIVGFEHIFSFQIISYIYIYIYKYIYFYNSVTNNNFLKKKITNNN